MSMQEYLVAEDIFGHIILDWWGWLLYSINKSKEGWYLHFDEDYSLYKIQCRTLGPNGE